jgi:hypothetical protein
MICVRSPEVVYDFLVSLCVVVRSECLKYFDANREHYGNKPHNEQIKMEWGKHPKFRDTTYLVAEYSEFDTK